MTEVETGPMQLQAKECQDILVTTRSQEEAGKDAPVQVSEKSQPHQHLDLGYLASGTVRTQTSVVLSYHLSSSVTLALAN